MGSSLVVVAIPDENDRVWKVSSEKIPHLTMLFLGDSEQVSNLDQIVQFVEHAADTSLRRFYLPVDRRGELGEDKADVLFFKKGRYDFKAVRDFRSLLLKDHNIKTAYDAASQFEAPEAVGLPGQPWIPHLTLGYPGSPAKPIPNTDISNFFDVSFNKIAVWTNNYEGPEFLLKDYWEEMDEMDIPMDVAMSSLRHISEEPWSNWTKADYTLEQWHAACLIHTHEGEPTSKSECKLPVKTPDGALNRNGVHAAAAALGGARGGLKDVSEDQKKKAANALKRYYSQLDEEPPESLAQSSTELGADFVLEHYGVKGMRWGVRKEDVKTAARSVGKAAVATARFAGDVGFESDVESGKAREAVIAKANPAFRRTDLPAVKARHGDYGKLRNRARKPFSQEARAYRKDAKETYIKRLETSANSMKNISGDRQYTIRERGWELPEQGGELPKSSLYWDVSSRKVRHAAEDKFTRLEVIFDDEGYISDLKKVEIEDTMVQTTDLGAEFLAHFGVKGMRWGVRKSQNLTEGQIKFHTRREAKAAEKADKRWRKDVQSTATAVKIHNAAADEVNAKLKDFNNDKRWQGVNLTRDTAKRKEYDEAFFKEIANPAYANAAVKVIGGTSPGGRYKFEIQDASKGLVKVTDTKKVKHADEEIATFKITRDANGFIIDIVPVETTMAQSTDLGADFVLEHYGVKGMRWGVRRAPPRAVPTSAMSHVPRGTKRKTKIRAEGGENQPASDDALKVAKARVKLSKSGTAALSNQELREVANRLQLEQQVKQLTRGGGQKFVSNLLREEGKQSAGRVIRRKAQAKGF